MTRLSLNSLDVELSEAAVIASVDSMSFITCWLFHRREREVLIPGVLPGQIDAVVFCWRCDRMRGRAVRVLQPTAIPAR